VNTTKENYDVAISTLLEGAALTVLVVWLFLRNWRATLVAAIALPLSILPAFWIMKLLGYTLNSISLLAITLVIGILGTMPLSRLKISKPTFSQICGLSCLCGMG